MAADHATMLKSIVDGFASTFGDASGVAVAMAPGRVNLLGDHTDYNDGYVLPMTIDRGVYLAIRKREDRAVRVASIRYGELVEYELDEFEKPEPGSWPSYLLGVVEELRTRELIDSGFDAVVDGNLNLGAGLSSSAALEVATAVSLQHIFGFEMSAVEMVKLSQYVEHTYANVLCGIMDQFACRVGQQGHALFLDCRSLDYRNVPVELGDYRIVIVSSEVRRSLASSAYNTRRAECQQAVDHFATLAPGVQALRDVSAELFNAHGGDLPENVRRRVAHVISENQRVLDAAASLQSGDLESMGRSMTESHASLRDDFEVSCPELDFLVELANSVAGVLGARMTGGGFGGCMVCIAHQNTIGTLVDSLCEDYEARFGLTPGIFVLEGNLEAGPIALDET